MIRGSSDLIKSMRHIVAGKKNLWAGAHPKKNLRVGTHPKIKKTIEKN
jgi:hypothetical protein